MVNIHDQVFKDVITDRSIAISFLRTYMPIGLSSKVDWRTVKLDSANVEHTRQQNKQNIKSKEQSDLVFQFKFRNGDLGACIAHIEAQMSNDITLLLRVRHYQTAYLLDFLKRNKSVKKLPLIVTIIFYANKKPFSYSLDLSDYFENPSLAREYAFTNQFVDITRVSDEEIEKHGHIAGVEYILKYIQNKEIDGNLEIAAKYLINYDDYISQTLIRYMSKYSDMETGVFYDKIIDKQPKLEGIVMTVAEQWEQQGVEKGIEKGKISEKRETAKSMIVDGLSVEKVVKYTRLSREVVEKLKEDITKKK
ncbi:Rpn family recombination-promoting nuclease/putative transposase [Thiotrichales bacterium 19S9-12]|nr:Rpn family recombination-promoting nuclease/putative transposase [Thiotrichales bacterium 19S9-11]MCF6811210.1 Rpn family recombination-promoting nuclease/putative transposase [Thiotrichales bacterium 19S9-12]